MNIDFKYVLGTIIVIIILIYAVVELRKSNIKLKMEQPVKNTKPTEKENINVSIDPDELSDDEDDLTD
jgi:hypothetical protein